MGKPDPVTKANVWDLGADPGEIRSTARLWTSLGSVLGDQAADLRSKSAATAESWKTPHGDSFRGDYAGKQADGLTDSRGSCTSVVSALNALAEELEGVQSDLDASKGRLTAAMPTSNIGVFGIDPLVRFEPDDGDDLTLIDTEFHKAESLISDAEQAVTRCNAALGKVPAQLSTVVSTWKGDASGTPAVWTNHPAPAQSFITTQSFGNTTVVNTTDLNEKVRVEKDPVTGETVLIVSTISTDDHGTTSDASDDTFTYTETKRIRIPAGQDVVINTGAGNDQVEVPEGVDVKLRFLLGDGDDQANNRSSSADSEIFGGAGRDRLTAGHGSDFISGGADSDYVDGGFGDDRLSGRDGNDTLYGLDGDDTLSGGSGRDYLDGSKGNDQVFGGADGDQVSGGEGDDRLFGGSGDDRVYAGRGSDFSDGGTDWDATGGFATDDADVVTQESGDTSLDRDEAVTIQIDASDGAFIQVKGSPEFQARVQSDIEFMRSSATGQQMLKTLGAYDEKDDGSWWFGQDRRPYVISEYPRDLVSDNGDAWDPDVNYSDSPPQDDAYCIRYRPEFNTLDQNDDGDYDVTPPVVVLYHEMGHTYQFYSDRQADGETNQGTGTVNSDERQNVGLDWYEKPHFWSSDHGDPNHSTTEDWEKKLRENGLREDLGIPDRTRY